MRVCVAVVPLALSAAPAAAAEPVAPPRGDSPSDERHYGAAVGVAYAIPLGVMLASVGLSALDVRSHETDERHAEPLIYGLLGLPVAVLAPPIVHWGHAAVSARSPGARARRSSDSFSAACLVPDWPTGTAH